jgi:hypothetical protein
MPKLKGYLIKVSEVSIKGADSGFGVRGSEA